MRLPSISVIFPTYNRCEVVRRTLECLSACDYPHELVEIIVGDNSSDDTLRWCGGRGRPFPIRLQESDERLPAVKRNQGLAARQATWRCS
ncbi:MAG: glycosyltransferase [Candidatus Microthrix sp.]|nr:glycosyltransferase [Candidatus Microthrix sp.]MBK7321535.1 glycosyltransferase [Candidatus Microthrix sp.]